ncbi:EscU/YscU/HrcU family type III secretion system export apparatus switch protein [Methylocapsa polymorpha]|uniref:EscU/YscU/HrcU family type III secretion system export apparatus switch protein n=1 Tax=Methylocapsa polymorpha TaxID=3080828 RepID=A0ABZ0HPU0_9HYPH|nr:EscU/YscU/HrcU family type III secretion system export apparatus switch protein [Methylocapsa sp. RX1]
MAEQADQDSKTEEPTENKIRDEVERGNVPISREASIFASVAGILIIAAFMIRESARSITITLERLFGDSSEWPLRNGFDAVALLAFVAWDMFRLLIPLFVILMVSGLLSSFLQNAPQIAPDRIRPDFQRISLVNGWRRIFGARGQAEFLKALFKLISVGAVISTVLRWEQGNLANAMAVEPEAIPEMILAIAMRLLSVVCIVTVLLLAVDLLWARAHWRRDLRMSKQDVKDELKRSEGDPLRKARLRSLALDRVRKSMIAAVPKATLVIANPTHYAIALRYVKEEGGAPVVLSKGQDLLALKIREIAEQNSIPIIEDKNLARSMYDSVEIDQAIPPEFYKAVAELIHFLYSKNPPRSSIK